MKKPAYAAVVLIALFSTVTATAMIALNWRQDAGTAALILDAFGETGARIVNSEVFICGVLKPDFCNDEAGRRQVITEMVKAAGGDIDANPPVFCVIGTDIARGTETSYIIDENCRIHVCIWREYPGNGEGKYKITASLTDTSRYPLSLGNAAKLAETAGKHGGKTEMNISVSGNLDGRLSEEEITQLCDRVFRKINAGKVGGISGENLVSITAFSPSIKEAVRVGGKRVNVNMAARYSTYDGKTYIWLATPVIATEY